MSEKKTKQKLKSKQVQSEKAVAVATRDMSKLSPSLKALINAPFARPGQAPAPRQIRDIYARIAHEARERKYGERPWVTLSVCFSLL
jgi:hypothetical protein